MDWAEALRERVLPVAGGVQLTASGLGVVLAVALVAVLVRPVWRVVRIAVTLVHELGHALVGMAVGRRFVGFVVRGDMSGHAVTAGRARGPARVVATWAGYPAPALVGAAAVWLAVRGWSAPVVSAAVVVSLLASIRARSLLTAVVVGVALAGSASLWWWRDDVLQQQMLVGVGLVLVVGAWRHLLAVTRDPGRANDPAILAALTHLPRALWTLSFGLVTAACSWLVAVQLLAAASR